MFNVSDFHAEILQIESDSDFLKMALKIFNYQYQSNSVYQEYCDLLKIVPTEIKQLRDIPFLPISFFKTHEIKSGEFNSEACFKSSGTTSMITSRHHVKSLEIYKASFLKSFQIYYGSPKDYVIIGLLPNYLEREGSSLVYMVDQLIKLSEHVDSGFYLHNQNDLVNFITHYSGSKKIFLIGVSYALMDLAQNYNLDLSKYVVMETGGMKGQRKEISKAELHKILKQGLKVKDIHSEYGMTELLTQAYSFSNGHFSCPPWMKILIRETNDPFSYVTNKSGGINVIDLANIHSCAFIATQDLGRYEGEFFNLLGRFDHSDLRGCNLLVQ